MHLTELLQPHGRSLHGSRNFRHALLGSRLLAPCCSCCTMRFCHLEIHAGNGRHGCFKVGSGSFQALSGRLSFRSSLVSARTSRACGCGLGGRAKLCVLQSRERCAQLSLDARKLLLGNAVAGLDLLQVPLGAGQLLGPEQHLLLRILPHVMIATRVLFQVEQHKERNLAYNEQSTEKMVSNLPSPQSVDPAELHHEHCNTLMNTAMRNYCVWPDMITNRVHARPAKHVEYRSNTAHVSHSFPPRKPSPTQHLHAPLGLLQSQVHVH
jgi:hypothetical protein